MAWYDDKHKLTHTETYSDAEAAANDAHKASAEGWQVETATGAQRRSNDAVLFAGGPLECSSLAIANRAKSS